MSSRWLLSAMAFSRAAKSGPVGLGAGDGAGGGASPLDERELSPSFAGAGKPAAECCPPDGEPMPDVPLFATRVSDKAVHPIDKRNAVNLLRPTMLVTHVTQKSDGPLDCGMGKAPGLYPWSPICARKTKTRVRP